MTPLTRILIALCCAGLSAVIHAHDLSRECPTSVAPGDDSISPFDLIWDVAGGTTSRSRRAASDGDAVGFPLVAALAADNKLKLLFSGSFSPDSPCLLEGVLEFANQDGVPLDEVKPVILTKDGFTLILDPSPGSASRCAIG
jgi:hypothetical protein